MHTPDDLLDPPTERPQHEPGCSMEAPCSWCQASLMPDVPDSLEEDR